MIVTLTVNRERLLRNGIIEDGPIYCPICAMTLRSGASEICSRPENGLSSSRMRKIAPETDSAHTNKVAITVVLRGENRPKLVKMTDSQNTMTTKNGRDIALPACSSSSERVRP